MRAYRVAWLALVALILCTTSNAQAWDGRRLGFLLGAGAGGGVFKTDFYDRPGVAGSVEFAAGFAPTDQLALLLTAPLMWSEYNSTPETHGRLAVQYWLRPDIPSMYFNVGMRNVNEPLNLYVGWGLEFRKHTSFEVGLTATFNNNNDATLLGKLLILGY